MTGTESLTDADFSRPLRDGSKHHVHDHHSANDQEYGNDADHGRSDRTGQIFPQFHQRCLVENAEVIFFVGSEVAPRAHHHSRLLLSPFHPFRPTRLNVEPNGVVGSIHLEIRLDGDIRKVILRLAKRCSDGLRNADYQEGPAFDHQFVPDGINAGKELGGQVVANHGDLGATLVVALGDVAAVSRHDGVNVRHVGCDAADISVVKAVRPGADF